MHPPKLSLKYFTSDDLLFLNEKTYNRLKKNSRERHKKLKITKPAETTLLQSHDFYAKKHEFKSWNHLNSVYKHEHKHQKIIGELNSDDNKKIFNARTFRQEYGAICRLHNIDPFKKRHEIHISIGEDRFLDNFTENDLRVLGLTRDEYFLEHLQKNDPYYRFMEISEPIYRVLSIDTDSFDTLSNSLEDISNKTDSFWPLFFKMAWIDGKINPEIMEHIEQENDEYNIKSPFPLTSLPEKIWNGGYK